MWGRAVDGARCVPGSPLVPSLFSACIVLLPLPPACTRPFKQLSPSSPHLLQERACTVSRHRLEAFCVDGGCQTTHVSPGHIHDAAVELMAEQHGKATCLQKQRRMVEAALGQVHWGVSRHYRSYTWHGCRGAGVRLPALPMRRLVCLELLRRCALMPCIMHLAQAAVWKCLSSIVAMFWQGHRRRKCTPTPSLLERCVHAAGRHGRDKLSFARKRACQPTEVPPNSTPSPCLLGAPTPIQGPS